MTTQKFMGRKQLIERLSAQVGNRDAAVKILQERGHLKADGKKFTAEGLKRNMMTAEERATDRSAKRLDKKPEAFKYNPKTNRATLRK